MIYNRMLEERNRLEKEIHSLEQQIIALPPGNLFFSHNGKYLKWYQSNGHNPLYIPKNNRQLAEQLAKKKYLSMKQNELIQERDAINLYLKHHNSNNVLAEQLNQPTISGHLVRSKSEALIDTILYKNKIPFRYEAGLSLGDTTFYPDFTIRHPLTGEIYYWEHFGMMDNPDYAKKAYSKLQRYSSYGITQDINLITTFETKEAPLNPEWVENLVKYHFM